MLGSDGSVYAEDGAQYYGGANNIKGDSLAGQHQFDQNSLALDPAGGYKITDTAGHTYDLNTDYAKANGFAGGNTPATNPLYQDPAFQAFIRSSGLGLETAAADIDRQVAAKNRAYTAQMSDLTDPVYGSIAQGRQNLAGGYESRGLSRSGERDMGLNKYDVAQGKSLSDLAAGNAEAVSGLQAQMPAKIADVAAQGAEKGLDVGASQEYNTGLGELKKKYPNAYGTGA